MRRTRNTPPRCSLVVRLVPRWCFIVVLLAFELVLLVLVLSMLVDIGVTCALPLAERRRWHVLRHWEIEGPVLAPLPLLRLLARLLLTDLLLEAHQPVLLPPISPHFVSWGSSVVHPGERAHERRRVHTPGVDADGSRGLPLWLRTLWL